MAQTSIAQWRGRTLALVAVVCCSGCRTCHFATIPPYDMTVTRMGGAGVRIQDFVAREGHMPKSLSELPVEPNRDCATTDGWGRPLAWSHDPTVGKFTISSLGRDGKRGGTGDDADICLTFNVIRDYHSSPPSPYSPPVRLGAPRGQP